MKDVIAKPRQSDANSSVLENVRRNVKKRNKIFKKLEKGFGESLNNLVQLNGLGEIRELRIELDNAYSSNKALKKAINRLAVSNTLSSEFFDCATLDEKM